MAEKKEFLQGKKPVTFVDLFAGAGGISEGFMQAYTDHNYYDLQKALGSKEVDVVTEEPYQDIGDRIALFYDDSTNITLVLKPLTNGGTLPTSNLPFGPTTLAHSSQRQRYLLERMEMRAFLKYDTDMSISTKTTILLWMI